MGNQVKKELKTIRDVEYPIEYRGFRKFEKFDETHLCTHDIHGNITETLKKQISQENPNKVYTVEYDLIGRLVMETGLTRRTLVAILKGIRPETFYQFRMNPEEFIRKTANIINYEKAMAVVQKICYERTGNTYEYIFSQRVLSEEK